MNAASSPRSPIQSPLTLYAVFHPDSSECRSLAKHLHDWFRLKFDDGDGTEAGLPIWIRARLRDARVHPEIRWEGAKLNVLVVLVDDHLVADAKWRSALERLCKEVGQHGGLVLPVAVDGSAYRLRFVFAKRNRLHAGDPRPNHEPEQPGTPPEQTARDLRIEVRARVLRRAVTESVIRELRERDPQAEAEADGARRPPDPLDVFLSHAKRDGRTIARSLRDGLADFGQLKTWFDENDLPSGYAWGSPMMEAVRNQTAALISVVTDAYPSRPWCRREVNLAREPRELDLGSQSGAKVTAWTVQPSVAVTQGRRNWSRPMAQLAHVPHLGWPGDGSEEVACIADVVDRLLLEALLVTFYRRLAPELAQRHANGGRNIALLTWVPDPWSLAHLRAGLLEKHEGPWILAYPGHGLRSAELLELRGMLQAMDFGCDAPRLTLTTQERLDELDLEKPSDPLLVALSGGGRASDVEDAGVGMEHVDDLMVRVTRRLLEDGHRIIYGGSLSDYQSNLTQSIIGAAQGWDRVRFETPTDEGEDDPSAEELERPPLTNYAAWPFYRFVQPRQRAELTGICDFVMVDPTDDPPAVPAHEADPRDNPEHARMMADALSRMRVETTRAANVRIVMAGTIRGWSGWLPGILEEFLCSCQGRQIPLVVGGFGGCAAAIAKFLANPAEPWPQELTFEAARADAPFRTLTSSDGALEAARERFQRAQETVSAWRDALHGRADWPFPEVERDLVLDLLDATSPSRVIDLVLRVLCGVGAD